MLSSSIFKSSVGKDVAVQFRKDPGIYRAFRLVDSVKVSDDTIITDPEKHIYVLSVKNCKTWSSGVSMCYCPQSR